MKRPRWDRYAFALILLTALLSLTPARADQAQLQPEIVALHLRGQATPMNPTIGSLGSAILDLTGGGLGDGQGGLMIQNLTGSLQIGSANYSISGGDGKTDTLGNFMLLGESSSGELILQGIIQHNSTVTTDATLSRLSSLAYLALSGSMTLADIANWSVVSGELSQNVTSTVENMTSTSPSVNSTSLTQSSSSSSVGNVSVQTEVTSDNATQSTSNMTSFGEAALSAALPQQNSTIITTTQLDNHTVTVYISTTVANSTITQITTTTVANTTITQIVSLSVSNTTVIVTNSTSSGH